MQQPAAPRLLSETTQATPIGTPVGTIFSLQVEIPDCSTPYVECESKDVGVTWLANPWGESALVGRRNVVPLNVENYRWSADTGPAGSKARFAALRSGRDLTVLAVYQQSYQLSTDPSNGAALAGVLASPRITVRVFDGDPLWLEWGAPNPSLFNGPPGAGYVSLIQTGPGATTEFGHPPGYARWFAGYANNGCQWQIGSPQGGFLVANIVNQRVSSGIHPMCRVQLFNGGGAPTQGSLTWSTQPIAI